MAKVKPLYEVRAALPAKQKSRACELNYKICKNTRKELLQRFKNSRTSRQSMCSYSNALPPMYRILLTPTLQSGHNYPVASLIS